MVGLQKVGSEGVAWFFMGEGTGQITVRERKKSRLGYCARVHVAFSNTEKELLKPIEDWLKTKGIPCHWSSNRQRKKGWKACHHLSIESGKGIKKLIELIYPHLRGAKKQVCNLLLEYCNKFLRPCGGYVRYNYTLEQEQKRFLEIMKLHDKIQDLNARRWNQKYRYEYFESLWS